MSLLALKDSEEGKVIGIVVAGRENIVLFTRMLIRRMWILTPKGQGLSKSWFPFVKMRTFWGEVKGWADAWSNGKDTHIPHQSWLGLVPCSPSDLSFLLMQILGSSCDGSSSCVPASHVGHLLGDPVPNFSSGLALAQAWLCEYFRMWASRWKLYRLSHQYYIYMALKTNP